MEGGLEPGGQLEGVKRARRAAALLRHVGSDVLPEVAKHGHLVARNVLGNGNPREFHYPALDGIHEREVTHGPREECAFGVARTL